MSTKKYLAQKWRKITYQELTVSYLFSLLQKHHFSGQNLITGLQAVQI